MEPPEHLDCERDHGLHLRRLRHVDGHELGLAARGADGVDRGPSRVLHRVGHDDLGALGREQLCAHPPEATARSRDQCDLPREPRGRV